MMIFPWLLEKTGSIRFVVHQVNKYPIGKDFCSKLLKLQRRVLRRKEKETKKRKRKNESAR